MSSCTLYSEIFYHPTDWPKETKIAVAVILAIAVIAFSALAILCFFEPYLIIALIGAIAVPELYAVGSGFIAVSLLFGGALLYLVLHKPRKEEALENEEGSENGSNRMPKIEPTDSQKILLQEITEMLSQDESWVPGWIVSVEIEDGQFSFRTRLKGRNGLTASNGGPIISISSSLPRTAREMIAEVNAELKSKNLQPLRKNRERQTTELQLFQGGEICESTDRQV